MSKALTIIERIVIPHTAFAAAQRQIEQCFAFSAGQGAQGLAIVGESGTGKTSLLETFESMHEPIRRDDGMEVPVLRATVFGTRDAHDERDDGESAEPAPSLPF